MPGGKLELQKDIAMLRIACHNKIPPVLDNDREMFLSIVEKQKRALSMDPVCYSVG